MNNCCKNTDKEIWRQTHEDYYSPSIHVTEQGAIGINCGGHVIVATVQEWHNWGKEALLDAVDHAAPAEPPKPTGEQLKAVGKVLAGDEPEPVVHYSCEGCGRKIIDEAFCRIGHLCCGRKRGHLRRNYTPKEPEPAAPEEVLTCEICGDEAVSLTTRMICDRCYRGENIL